MPGDTTLETELRRLQRSWEALTDAPAVPRSTMDVIEYGLDH